MTGIGWIAGLTLLAVASGPARAQAFSFASHSGQDCVKVRHIKTETAETESSLIVHTNDGRAYRNSLPEPCDGLQALNDLGKLRLGGKDGLLCAGDIVWLEHEGIASALGVGATPSDAGCKLGTFEPISEMSLTEALRR